MTSMSSLPLQLHYTDLAPGNSHTRASKHRSRNAGQSQRSTKGKVKGSWGKTTGKPQVLHKLHSIPSSLLGNRQEVPLGPCALPLLPPCHPRPTLALCYLPQAMSKKKKLDLLILSSSGPPPSLCASTLQESF